MSPAIYTSFEIEDSDDIAERQKKLYLGMISCGEQAYTLGAAISECRKQLEALDKTCAEIKREFFELKDAIRERTLNSRTDREEK